MLTEEQIKEVVHSCARSIERGNSLLTAVQSALKDFPPTQDGIPLQIDPRWKWAAMDESDDWHGYENKPEDRDDEWILDGGEFVKLSSIFSFPKTDNWRDSLHQIINGRLVKYVDIPADEEKAMVKHFQGDNWMPRYSTGKVQDGKLVCYDGGTTKWSSQGMRVEFPYFRRPTQEELNQ